MNPIVTLFCIIFVASAGFCQSIDRQDPKMMDDYHKRGFLIVTQNGPLDGGDFGRFTPGTRTAGIQEAIDYAMSLVPQKNVWISGKQDDQKLLGTYLTLDTIYVPPTQGLTIDGNLYVLFHWGKGPVIWVDSAMNCKYHFGIIGSFAQDPGPGVLVKPTNLFRIDTWCGAGTVGLDFRLEAILTKAQPGLEGLVLDASKGTIYGNKFLLNECTQNGTGFAMTCHSQSFGIISNEIKVTRDHGNLVQMRIGDPDTPPQSINSNKIEIEMTNDGIPNLTGADLISCQNNIITVLSATGLAPGRDIVFGPKTKQNIVMATRLDDGITNNAEVPTNRIIGAWPVGFSVETPKVPESGQAVVNRNPYTIEVIITEPGQVTEWALMDANGKSRTIKAGLSAGQQITLAPGDSVRLTHSAAPAWEWRALP